MDPCSNRPTRSKKVPSGNPPPRPGIPFGFSDGFISWEFRFASHLPVVTSLTPFRVPLDKIHQVYESDSANFRLLLRGLRFSCVVALDAEWNPFAAGNSSNSCPTVTLLQVACLLCGSCDGVGDAVENGCIFLIDLLALPLSFLIGPITELFQSSDILKLGFRFKQDLAYLSSTFSFNGCDSSLDKIEPYLDIANIYHLLHANCPGKKVPTQIKSLAKICEEVLGVGLSKELQCSDWSRRPLSEEQILYAAADVQCLLEVFIIFQSKFVTEGNSLFELSTLHSKTAVGLKAVLSGECSNKKLLGHKFLPAVDIVKTTLSCFLTKIPDLYEPILFPMNGKINPFEDSVLKISSIYGERIFLENSGKKSGTTRRRCRRKHASLSRKSKAEIMEICDWEGPAPWDSSSDGCPKFLCDAMVEGLAKQLRCVGIDAATPHSKKPDSRDLIEQAVKENRVLLTRDRKLLGRRYLSRGQMYEVKNLVKGDQLIEIIEAFQLKISEEQLMSRCIKCNGRFIQKPLTTDEAIAAARGMQVIPECLYNRNFEFWQCESCGQIYWEGTQYHNALQKYMNVCNLNE